MSTVIDRRSPSTIGRHARLELVFRAIGGVTQMDHAYAEPPLRVGRALRDGTGVHVILASSAPGIFGGDLFEQRVVVEPGARVRFMSQSALQVHPSVGGGAARVRSAFDVADDSELRCEWDALIPFAESRFEQEIDIRLAPTARLIWSDAFMAGREGRGERWQFADLRHRLRVARAGSVEYLERYRIQPLEEHLSAPWTAGECCYFGSIVASGWDVSGDSVDALQQELGAAAGVHGAIDRLGPGLLLARLAAHSGPAFHGARQRLVESLADPTIITGITAGTSTDR